MKGLMIIRWLSASFALGVLCGCWGTSQHEVVVYAALDREFSEPILHDFSEQTGVVVLPKFDVESTKTVGLVSSIIQERARPRCDVFWNNEILHTLRLQKMGLLESYLPPAAGNWPADYRSPDGQWYGLAARARVLIVNSNLVPRDQWPDSIEDLADPRWKGRVGIAKPLFGTTATHAAVLFAEWGDERAKKFFQDVKVNDQILSGNKAVAEAVSAGTLAFGLTDTDDAIIEKDKGNPVEIVFPDQNGQGTLFVPNSIAIIKGSANQASARQLIDYLLRAETERQLAKGASAQFPVNPQVKDKPRVAPDETVRWMKVDFAAAAAAWDTASQFLRDEFATGE